MGSVVKTIVGVALIAVGIFVPGAQFLIGPGIGLVIQGFWVEDSQITFTSGAAGAPYVGALSRFTNDGTVGNAALSVGAGVKWTSASKFRGCAHYVLKWVYSQDKLPQGIPSRYTCEV